MLKKSGRSFVGVLAGWSVMIIFSYQYSFAQLPADTPPAQPEQIVLPQEVKPAEEEALAPGEVVPLEIREYNNTVVMPADTQASVSTSSNSAASDKTEEVKGEEGEVISLYDQLRQLVSDTKETTPLKDALEHLLAEQAEADEPVVSEKLYKLIKEFEQTDEKETTLFSKLETMIDQTVTEQNDTNYRPSYMPCKPTPTLDPSYVPEDSINKNGNLMRKPGAVERARGQYVHITGHVVDEQCVPIPNAVIQIWQHDDQGKGLNDYITKTVWDTRDPDYDKNFAYTGTAQTDNNGKFSLLTIFPGVKEEDEISAPHINIKVLHSDFKTLKTRMYFAKHPRNESDNILASLNIDYSKKQPDIRGRVIAQGKPIDKNNHANGREYELNLVLDGIAHYRRF